MLTAGLLLTACGISDDHQAALDNLYLVPDVTAENIRSISDTACNSFSRDPDNTYSETAIMGQTALQVSLDHGLTYEDAMHTARIIGLNVCPDVAMRHMYPGSE